MNGSFSVIKYSYAGVKAFDSMLMRLKSIGVT